MEFWIWTTRTAGRNEGSRDGWTDYKSESKDVVKIVKEFEEVDLLGDAMLFGLCRNYLEEQMDRRCDVQESLEVQFRQDGQLRPIKLGVHKVVTKFYRECRDREVRIICQMCRDEVDCVDMFPQVDDHGLELTYEPLTRMPYVYGRGVNGALLAWVKNLGYHGEENLYFLRPKHMTMKVQDELQTVVQFSKFYFNGKFHKNFTVNAKCKIGRCQGSVCNQADNCVLYFTNANEELFSNQRGSDSGRLDYICRVCYNYYLTETRDLDIKCNRCMETYDHRAVWPGSYSRGPLCYDCLVSHWKEGVCPVCEKFVVCLSDWINVSVAWRSRGVCLRHLCGQSTTSVMGSNLTLERPGGVQ